MCLFYDYLGPSINSIQFLGVILDSSLPFLQFFSYTKGFYIGNILFLVWKLLYALYNVLVFIIMSSSKTKQLLSQKLKINYRWILTLWIFLQHKCFDCRFNINSMKKKILVVGAEPGTKSVAKWYYTSVLHKFLGKIWNIWNFKKNSMPNKWLPTPIGNKLENGP